MESSFEEFNNQILSLINKVESEDIDLSKEVTVRDYIS
jgi:hypothetical protein